MYDLTFVIIFIVMDDGAFCYNNKFNFITVNMCNISLQVNLQILVLQNVHCWFRLCSYFICVRGSCTRNSYLYQNAFQ